MRKLLSLLALAALAACSRDSLFSGTPRYQLVPPGQRDTAAAVSETVPPGEHLYLTAVRYPDGYAWEEDTCAVEGTVWIDLYRDGQCVRSIPAGESVHPDMHRFMDGHLYTDFSTEEETVLCRDGAELFRFTGREAIRGFLVLDGAVHTLGQDRDGQGFTYRIDGREAFRSETGVVLGTADGSGSAGGALAEEGGAVYFSYWLPDGTGKEYRVMRDAELYQTLPKDYTGEVLDLRVLGGKVFRVRKRPRGLVLEKDDGEVQLDLQAGETARRCRIVPWKDDVLVLGYVARSGVRRYFIQSEKGAVFSLTAGVDVSDLLSSGDRMGWIETDGEGAPVRFRRSDGTSADIGGKGYLSAGRCALLGEDGLLLALTGRDGAPNRLWTENGVTDFPFNGCFTSITVE